MTKGARNFFGGEGAGKILSKFYRDDSPNHDLVAFHEMSK